jgi:hypothetical protein
MLYHRAVIWSFGFLILEIYKVLDIPEHANILRSANDLKLFMSYAPHSTIIWPSDKFHLDIRVINSGVTLCNTTNIEKFLRTMRKKAIRFCNWEI